MIPGMSELPPPGPSQPAQDPVPPPPNAGQAPPPNPYQPYAPGYGPGGVPQWAPDHPQTTVILILGIIGVTVFQICAPIAWYLGNKAKAEIEASNGAIGGLSMVNLGRILGIVGTAILALSVLIVVGAIVVIVIAAASSA